MSTPYMGLVLPTVSVTPGPTYATENNTAFETIDAHDHTTGKGVPITPSGININADLEFNSHNATEVRSVIFDSQSAALAVGTDVGCIYNLSGNPAWNDNTGTATRVLNTSYPFVVGDIPYASSTTVMGRLAIGTSGQVLKVSGGIPSWQTAANSFVSSTQTGASFTASVSVDLYLCNPSTTQTISLPASTGSGHAFTFKKVNSGIDVLTINRAGSDVIVDSSGNVTSTTLNLCGEDIQIVDVSSGVWQIVLRRIPSIWTSSLTFTPTSFGTVTASSFFSRRSGDSIEVRGYFTCGTPTGVDSYIGLASGIVVDTAKIQGTTKGIVGEANILSATSGTISRVTMFFDAGQTSRVYFSTSGSSAVYGTATGSGMCSAGDGMALKFIIPVSGWNG